MKKPYFISLLLLLAAISTLAADTTRVLWLGNSLIKSTYSRIKEVSWCAEERGVPIYQEYGNYQYDAENGWNKVPANKDLIKNKHWDYVVVQVFGTSGCVLKSYAGNPLDSILAVMSKWDALIDSVGAKTVFYMPWGTDGYKPSYDPINKIWKPDRMDTATSVLRTKAAELDAALFPVGTAQFEVQKRDPSVRLFLDWIHGSAAAGYLGGLISYTVITGQDPRGMRNFYPNDLDSITVFFLQQLAWQTVFNSTEIPFRGNWTAPAIVSSLVLRAPSSNSNAIEQYLETDLVCDLVKTDATTESGTNKALFVSLTPEIASVNHFGRLKAKATGLALIEARAGDAADTIAITVTPSTATYDSVRISPETITGYVVDGYQFYATGYAFKSNQLISVDFTNLVTWESSDTNVFKLINGKIRKTSALGGSQWVAVNKDGLTDTVRFSMLQDLSTLLRINFQAKDTSYNPYWKSDLGRPFTDSIGYGWVNSPVVSTYAIEDDIRFNDSIFLTSTCVTAAATSTAGSEGTFKIKCHDADYIIRVALGHPYYNRNCYIRHGNDTLFKFNGTQSKLIGIKTDTITVREEQGIILHVSGPIAYLVIATSEGVNMDSIAYDTKATMPSGGGNVNGEYHSSKTETKPPSILISPNPFNPHTKVTYSGIVYSKAKIFSASGRLIAELAPTLANSSTTYTWNAKNVSPGIYLIEIYTRGAKSRTKMVLIK